MPWISSQRGSRSEKNFNLFISTLMGMPIRSICHGSTRVQLRHCGEHRHRAYNMTIEMLRQKLGNVSPEFFFIFEKYQYLNQKRKVKLLINPIGISVQISRCSQLFRNKVYYCKQNTCYISNFKRTNRNVEQILHTIRFCDETRGQFLKLFSLHSWGISQNRSNMESGDLWL